MQKYNSYGICHYSKDNNGLYKAILVIDPDIVRYCLSILPKYIDFQPQKYKPHISWVRKLSPDDLSINFKYWGLYENYNIWFSYNNVVYHDETYIWVDCYSHTLNSIRKQMNLPEKQCFHITLGNFKHVKV